jgi:hypothetical protein
MGATGSWEAGTGRQRVDDADRRFPSRGNVLRFFPGHLLGALPDKPGSLDLALELDRALALLEAAAQLVGFEAPFVTGAALGALGSMTSVRREGHAAAPSGEDR